MGKNYEKDANRRSMMRFAILQEGFENILAPEEMFSEAKALISKGKHEQAMLKLNELSEISDARYAAFGSFIYSLAAYHAGAHIGEIFDRLCDAETAFRRNASYYGDTEYIGVCIALYFIAELYAEAGESNRQEAYQAMDECGMIYRNLAARDDLFDQKQTEALNMLADLSFSIRDKWKS